MSGQSIIFALGGLVALVSGFIIRIKMLKGKAKKLETKLEHAEIKTASEEKKSKIVEQVTELITKQIVEEKKVDANKIDLLTMLREWNEEI